MAVIQASSSDTRSPQKKCDRRTVKLEFINRGGRSTSLPAGKGSLKEIINGSRPNLGEDLPNFSGVKELVGERTGRE